jgi:hypothetical protein
MGAEEESEMKVSSMALSFGFFLVVGLPLAASAGPLPGGADGDGDTVEDAFDNCTLVGNADQADADHDGCGDVCDPTTCCDNSGLGPDLVPDGAVGIVDFQVLVSQLGTVCSTAGDPLCAADCASPGPVECVLDLAVGIADFQAQVAQTGNVNGPSGITNPSRDPLECP